MKTFRFKASLVFDGVVIGEGETAEEAAENIIEKGDYGILDVERNPVGVDLWDDGTEV